MGATLLVGLKAIGSAVVGLFGNLSGLFGDLFRWLAWWGAYRLGVVKAGDKAKAAALSIRERQLKIMSGPMLHRRALLDKAKGRKRGG